jgi:peptidoglycan/xylan/chitin deacetylase (PgdA/CDA1 family)
MLGLHLDRKQIDRRRGKIDACVRALGATLTLLLAPALTLPDFGEAAVKRGTSGADSLVGTAGPDTLSGLGGGDKLAGRAAADLLLGGPGADRLTGGPAPDRLLGASGNDRILARDGVGDTVHCGRGSADVAVVDGIDGVSPSCERVEASVLDQPPVPQPPASNPPFADAGPPFVVNGDRSFRIGSLGNGTTAVASSPELERVNLNHAHVSIQGMVSLSARLQTVKLRLASGDIDSDYAEATVWQEDFDPIILGSTFEFQSLARGDFAVTGQVDWSNINRAQILVTDNQLGEVAFYVAGIYAVPDHEKAMVSFAFDDGYESTFTRALKKLSTYRYPASAYVITDIVGAAKRLSLEQLHKLRDLYHWEIGGHSKTLASHNLPRGLDDLEPEALKAEMDGLRDWLYENGFSRASFAYPKGAAAPRVRHYAERDYCAGRVTARGPETLPARDEYTLRGWSINGLESDEVDLEAAVDKAVSDGTWLILSFHDIVAGTPSQPTEFDDDEFEAVVDHVRNLQKHGKLKVRTVGDAVASHCAD